MKGEGQVILGVYGFHNTGKTQFLEQLIKQLGEKGISAAAIKHLGGQYEFDPDKDTGRLAKSGFDPVVGVGNNQLIIRMSGHDNLWSAISLIQLLSSPDVIFVEGFKNEPIEKIAVGEIKKLPGTVFHADQLGQIIQYIQERVADEKSSESCKIGSVHELPLAAITKKDKVIK